MAEDKKDHIVEMYKACGLLKGDNPPVESFVFILDSVKGDTKAKTLAAQLIPSFAHIFPALVDRALDAQFDLCEDVELLIRIPAIRGLGELCKHSQSADLCKKVADVLSQLLPLAEDKNEQQTVKRTFSNLFEINANAVFSALFEQIAKGTGEALREKAINMLVRQLGVMGARIKKDKELSAHLIAEYKKILVVEQGVPPAMLKALLPASRLIPGLARDAEVAELYAQNVLKQAQLEREFDPSNEEHVDSLEACASIANSLGKAASALAPKLVASFFEKVVPVFEAVPEKSRLSLLRAMASLSSRCPAATAEAVVDSLWSLMITVMPKSEDATAEATPADVASPITSQMNFDVVECLLFMFHQLAGQSPTFVHSVTGQVISTGQPGESEQIQASKDMRADFRSRMAFAAKHAKEYHAQLRKVLANISASAKTAATDEEKATLKEKSLSAQAMLRTTQNIVTMAAATKDKKFLKNVPLSWKSRGTGAKPKQDGGKKPDQKKKGGGDKGKQPQQKGGQQQQQQGRKRRGGGGAGAGNQGKKAKGQQQQPQQQQQGKNKRRRGGNAQQQQQQQQSNGKSGAKRRKSNQGANNNNNNNSSNKGTKKKQNRNQNNNNNNNNQQKKGTKKKQNQNNNQGGGRRRGRRNNN